MEVSLTAVMAQVINFGIVFFIFRKFLAKPIIKSIEERRSLIKKLENADQAYTDKIAEAEEESKKIIKEWLKKKDQLIAEGGVVANKRKEEIISEAHTKAEKVISEAEQKTQVLEKELENNFLDWVKRTAMAVVKKLVNSDKEIQSQYLDNIVKEVSKS